MKDQDFWILENGYENMKPKSKNINLVLSGTGALYPAHVGAVCALRDLNYNIKAISGTSGGAIVATAVVGQVSKQKFKRRFLDFNPWNLLFQNGNIFSKGWGVYSNQVLIRIMNRIGGQTTFAESPIPVHFVATKISPTYDTVIFNKETTPNMTLGEACRISSNIPILFKAIPYKGNLLIDGMFSDNLHIKPFEDDFENTIAIAVKVKAPNNPTNFWQYIKTCFSMLLSGQGEGSYIPKNLTYIPVDIYDTITPLKFNFSRADRKRLFETGYNAVVKYLQVDQNY